MPLEGPDGLRERFYLQGKYAKVNDFRRKVIDVAKKELDESSPYSFVAKAVSYTHLDVYKRQQIRALFVQTLVHRTA